MESNQRKILFVTGTRADFGKLEPLASMADRSGFLVTFFVTGMHMLKSYGLTKKEIHKNKQFSAFEFVNQRPGDPQDVIFAKTVLGFSDYVAEIEPDLVVVHGDRIEAMACLLVCATNYIRSIHVEGGELSGTIDEVLRHCNTKLATSHMVSSQDAAIRISRLGEHGSRIFPIGSPELDIHASMSGPTLREVLERYEIANEDYGVCIFHPVTSETYDMPEQARVLFAALQETGRYFVVIKPNNDPGSEAIQREISALPVAQFRVIPSMRFSYFSVLLKNCNLVIGNSSTGVREAPYLGVGSINLGSRQKNRSLASSIINIHPASKEDISLAVREIWGRRFSAHYGYGSGNSVKKFGDILSGNDFWTLPLQKYFDDI